MSGEINIQKLKPIDHIRIRPGMYIGGVDERALHQLVYEILNDTVNEMLTDLGDHLWIKIQPDNEIFIRDNGKGISVDVSQIHKKRWLELVLTHPGSRVDWGQNNYYIHVGLTGVGMAAVNALSSVLTAEVAREGYLWRQSYREGVPQTEVLQVRPLGENEATGTTLTFTPDFTIIEKNDFQYELIVERARELAYLVPSLTIVVSDERPQVRREDRFYFPKGLGQLVTDLNEGHNALHEPIKGGDEWIIQRPDQSNWKVGVDFALQYTDSMETIEQSYANTIRTNDGGTHVSGIWAAITGKINEAAVEIGEDPFSQPEIAAGLTVAVSIKHEHPSFESQTRIRLINPDAFGIVAGIVYMQFPDLLQVHNRRLLNELGEIILSKCRKNRKALRK